MFKKIYVLRIRPDQNLVKEILKFSQNNHIQSAVIISILGSLKNVELGFLKKLPGQFIKKSFKGPLEIVNGTGTIATNNSEVILHLHLEISDEKKAIGGHLIKGTVFSTAEVVIGELEIKLKRYFDEFTGLNELKGN